MIESQTRKTLNMVYFCFLTQDILAILYYLKRKHWVNGSQLLVKLGSGQCFSFFLKEEPHSE